MNSIAWQQQATEYLYEGKYQQAATLYEQCIEVEPDQVSNYWHLGLMLLLQGQEEEAQSVWFSVLLEAEPEQVEVWSTELLQILTVEAERQESIAEPEIAWLVRQHMQQLAPEDSNNLLHLVLLAIQMETLLLDDASILVDTSQSIQSAQANGIDRNLLLQVLEQLLDFNSYHPAVFEFIDSCFAYSELAVGVQNTLPIKTYVSQRYYNLGLALQNQQKLDEAIDLYERALQLDPNSAETYNNLGMILQKRGQLDEAIHLYQKGLQIEPIFTGLYNNLGIALQEQGKLDEAMAYYEKVLQFDSNDTKTYLNIGRLRKDQKRIEEAISSYQSALRADYECAEAHSYLGMMQLLIGNFDQGWSEYEWRWKDPQFSTPVPRFEQPLWDGSSLEGKKILLLAEQGLGDAIQFIRYAPMVKNYGGTVVLECHPPLGRLMRSSNGVDEVYIHYEPLPKFDVYVPLLSLPRIFGTQLDSVPNTVPYLQPPNQPNFEVNVLDDASSNLKVGLVWASSPIPDPKRSCALAEFETLLQSPGTSFFSLQKGPEVEQIKPFQEQNLIVDLGSDFQDLADTAFAISHLDLVISVDTSVAHLAGAMGKPTWILLPFVPDWRWLLEGNTSPWYPTVQLFRQAQPNDWQNTLRQVSVALAHFVAESTNLS
ncbi:tetratricopeptide repeat protein [Leptolyngbya sp. FACHB-261]|uniref:tetratricopeptide repeat protein n=1 Tax=Leptolyngbya sp. FACHB-261 TaxID=2692806 RepID=UPI001688864D|nr:tetratricopeptide repeat protein [Leptolyngbya sp. FACHB-261]MBD2103005.1 tetratricopeptide repeat protein [Leptolyngbya sp. FACHB-261]